MNVTNVTDVMNEIEEQGYAVVELLSERELRLLERAFLGLEPPPAAGFRSTLVHGDPARRKAVDTVLRAILGPRLDEHIAGFAPVVCSFATKPPGGEPLPLHQDWTFVDEQRHASLGIWCPLADVDESNGCLAVIPGSQGLAREPRVAMAPPLYPELVREGHRRLRSIPMRAGQAMIFDQRLFHASGPNRSGNVRVAATAVAVPCGAPLRHYCFLGRAPDDSEALLAEIFAVDEDFFVSHPWGSPPQAYPSLGLVRIAPGSHTPLLEQQRVRARRHDG